MVVRRPALVEALLSCGLGFSRDCVSPSFSELTSLSGCVDPGRDMFGAPARGASNRLGDGSFSRLRDPVRPVFGVVASPVAIGRRSVGFSTGSRRCAWPVRSRDRTQTNANKPLHATHRGPAVFAGAGAAGTLQFFEVRTRCPRWMRELWTFGKEIDPWQTMLSPLQRWKSFGSI